MTGNKVTIYFENQEDALRFTVAAGAVIAGESQHIAHAAIRNMERATRITTQGTLGETGVSDS